MLIGFIVIAVLVVLLCFLGKLLLGLLFGAMKYICIFSKPVFAMFISWLVTSGSDGVFVRSPFWDWLLLFAVIYAVFFALCGFPRVNRDFDAFTSMILVFLLALVVGGVTLAISSSIFGEFWLSRLWDGHYTLICLALSFAGPFITYRLQRDFTTAKTKKVDTFTEKQGLFHSETVDVYETTVTAHDLSKHFFTFGDRWPVIQRLLAAFVYALYPGIILMDQFTKMWHLKTDLKAWAVCIAAMTVLTAAAYYIQLLLERRKSAAESGDLPNDADPSDDLDDIDFENVPKLAEYVVR